MKPNPGVRQTLFAVLALPATVLSLAAGQAHPNIVWLTTEDNSAHWYRLYNDHGAPMPNIERLAAHGLVFNHAFSCAPVCSVARSTILSGCYPSRLGAQYHRPEMPVRLPEGVRPFPWHLRKAGYYTTNNSKTDYNFPASDIRGTWDESSGKATYRNRQPGQPFFHVQNFAVTHESRLFGGLPKGVESTTDPASVELFPYHPDTPLFREKYAQYLTLQTYVDSQMGKLIGQLEADGLLDDTFIFHYGDHGGVLPGSKGYACNDGLQVAMVVYVPKNWHHLVPAQPGSRIDGFVEFVDLSATVLNLAGIDIPEGIDGRPFLGPGVTLDALDRRDTAFGVAERFDEKYDLVRFLRRGRFSYHRSYQPFNPDGLYNEYRYKQPAYREWRELHRAGRLNAVQAAFFEPRQPEGLYDLETDPHETRNLAGDPAHAGTLAEMRGLLQERLRTMPDTGFVPEPVLVAESNGDGYGYGQRNQARLARLLEIADLQLLPFDAAQSGIARALGSPEPLERYWGLITCSAFCQQAAAFYDRARQLAANDPNGLVRTRAAEFLGLTRAADPVPVWVDVLRSTTDPIEANLILNTVVLLRDRQPGINFDFAAVDGAPWTDARKTPGLANQVQRRVEQFRNNDR
ncbi:MAG: sulfatase [Verrucomicrobiales bacterium]|nr:sulfatase [Verrucomicrobiales bacterium]